MVNEYHVLKELAHNPGHTQRSLARTLGVSLGKTNYVLSGLVDKGIIKVRKLTNRPGSIRWQYVLTPEGIQEKVRITRDYLVGRMAQFEAMQKEIDELNREIGHVPDASPPA